LKTRKIIFFFIFSLGVVALYFLFVELYIPKARPAPPPKEEALSYNDISLISEDEFVSFGERIFTGKGSCRLCHTVSDGRARPARGRAPALVDIAFTAEDRLQEAGYKGRAVSATGYILESMLEPSVYVVEGYGKMAEGLVVSPMPVVTATPVNLTPFEVRAVVAYLFYSSGVEIDIKPSLELPTYRHRQVPSAGGAER